MNDVSDDTMLMGLAGGLSRAQRTLGHTLSVHGIGFSEYHVLWHLDRAEGHALRRIDLAERLGLSASGITRLVNPMEKIGLVARQSLPRDARVSLVALTKTGKRIFAESSVAFQARAGELLGGLSASERRAVGKAAATLAG